MSIHSLMFAGTDIRVAELQTGRYFNKADLLRVAGKRAQNGTEYQFLDILEAGRVLGVERETLLEAMQLWSPHLCSKSVIEVH